MHPFIPSQLRGIRTQFGPSAVIEPERPAPPPAVTRAPILACQFVTGTTTPAMEAHAESVSAYYYAKRAGRNANQRRAP